MNSVPNPGRGKLILAKGKTGSRDEPAAAVFSSLPGVLLLGALLFAGCAGISENMGFPPAAPPAGTEQEPAAAPSGKPFVPDGYFEKTPPLGEKGYLLMPLAPDVYFFSSGVYNTMFVVTTEGVVLVDPIRGQGERIKRAIGEITSQPVRFMIYSHPHLDHIGDAHLFAGDTQIIAHRETRKLLELYKDPNRPIPHITFGKNYSLSLGGIQIDLIYPGEGHGKGNIIIYLPQRKVLMYVDVATPRAVPFKNFVTINIYSQIKGIERALKLDFDVYVAGHLHRPGKKKEMKEVLKYYFASKRADVLALKRVAFKDVRSRSRTQDVERLFGEYYEAVAEECYRILKKDWTKRLMGFEAFARGHCDVWTSFHRTHLAP
ncbi:MAG: MBL fold metallo-hydrolase [Nitrospinaceae bacterium]